MVKRYKWNWGALILLISAWALADSQPPVKVAQSPAASSAIPAHSFLTNLGGMALVDQHGRSFEAGSLVDHVVLFNFFFTGCGSVCPLQTRILAQVFRELPADVRKQVRFVSVSIDPDNDTPERLRNFSKTMDAELAEWSFLTGDAGQIEGLAQRLRLFKESEPGVEPNPQLHRTSLWLVDKEGRMLQRYRGEPPDKERLIKELTQVSRMTVR
jgi:protein SCO1/2